jgi:hypothetical protein
MHIFFNCSKNSEAEEAMFRVEKAYKRNLSMEREKNVDGS